MLTFHAHSDSFIRGSPLVRLLGIACLLLLLGCTAGGSEPVAPVTRATTIPSPAPNIQATVTAQVAATVSAVPTPTPASTPAPEVNLIGIAAKPHPRLTQAILGVGAHIQNYRLSVDGPVPQYFEWSFRLDECNREELPFDSVVRVFLIPETMAATSNQAIEELQIYYDAIADSVDRNAYSVVKREHCGSGGGYYKFLDTTLDVGAIIEFNRELLVVIEYDLNTEGTYPTPTPTQIPSPTPTPTPTNTPIPTTTPTLTPTPDPRVTYYSVGISVSAALFDGTNLWFTSPNSDQIIKMDLEGKPLGTFNVGALPYDLAFGGKAIWIANNLDRTVWKMSLDGELLGMYSVGSILSSRSALAFDGEALWIANSQTPTVTRMALDGEILGVYDEGGTGSIEFGGNAIWIPDYANKTVIKLGLDGTKLGEFDVRVEGVNETYGPVDLEFDGTSIWVLNGHRDGHDKDTIIRLALDGVKLITIKGLPTPSERGNVNLVSGGEDIWVARGNLVTRIDPSGAIVDSFSLSVTFIKDIVSTGDAIWVTFVGADQESVARIPIDPKE